MDLQSLKKQSFSDAEDLGLIVFDDQGNEIAHLIPIGNWVLKDDFVIQSFANWRRMFMRFFLSQFQASFESSYNYLSEYSIKQNNRILFAIYLKKELLGHLGFCEVVDGEANLDNVIRGVSGGHKDLIFYAERTILEWGFDVLDLRKINALVISKNVAAHSLHKRIGFKLKNRFHLRKIVQENETNYVRCEPSDATENFFLDIVSIDKKSFFKFNK